ncbi:1-acyl-sn-glycerol-3-phosphate acyltransferase [Candidatus Kinetoplastibacterium desouzaii TCC079E]|uniref:1-acyl-sn-glycerol-3-phosphate acyltransferase n=1 Tax=Candidatus Kinetoplastidibacterium desouzai TCC079E TaxID=1208919 RepID=M1LV04_9PROT|nr:lysophospholipid acyltransferase family protein [Candidatus Kinetoplastibacterium desouzaii]AGF47114.1 1-acyl-sn-glycerol-3-phosphate acyltransferase [Candidatus Kinetoplastibacterium desouzaii TCC079E]
MNKTTNYIRSCIYLIFLIITVIPYSLISLSTILLSLNTRYKIISFWPKIALWGLKTICLVKWDIKGFDNLPKKPIIIFSNHQSAWETLFFISQLPKKTCFVYKKELHNIPFFGWGLYLLNMIAIDRSNGKNAIKKILEIGRKKIKEDYYIVVFPEGTRSTPKNINRFKIGGALFAANSKINIIPIAHNAGNFWQKDSFIIKPGTIQMSIGPIINTEHLKSNEINNIAFNWIKKELEKLNS